MGFRRLVGVVNDRQTLRRLIRTARLVWVAFVVILLAVGLVALPVTPSLRHSVNPSIRQATKALRHPQL